VRQVLSQVGRLGLDAELSCRIEGDQTPSGVGGASHFRDGIEFGFRLGTLYFYAAIRTNGGNTPLAIAEAWRGKD
jgi:hypothetical protein